MIKDDGVAVLFVGILIGFIAVGLSNMQFKVSSADVMSGKDFIFKDATYKCTKTNELKEN